MDQTPPTPPFCCFELPHCFYITEGIDIHHDNEQWHPCERVPCPHRHSQEPNQVPDWGKPCYEADELEYNQIALAESLEKARLAQEERKKNLQKQLRQEKKLERRQKRKQKRESKTEQALAEQLSRLNLNNDEPTMSNNDEHTKKESDSKFVPKRYNGNRKRYQAFKDSLELFFEIDDKYTTDKKKVAFVLSLLDDGEARTWRTNFLREARKNGALKLGSYEDLMKKLDKTFKRSNEEEEALFELNNMKQRNDETAEQAITRFRDLASLAGLDLTTNQRIAIDYLKDALNDRLVDKISTDINEPDDDFEKWVTLAIKYDNNFCRNKILRSLGKRGNTSNVRNTLRAFSRTPQRNTTTRDPDAMDIDAITLEERNQMIKNGQCFYCREKGHRAKECSKKPKKNDSTSTTTNQKKSPKEMARHIRNLLAQYSPEEELEIMNAAEEDSDEDSDDKEDF